MNCTECKRPMRPSNKSAEECPGTVRHGGRGRCKTCLGREHRKDEATRIQDLTPNPDHVSALDYYMAWRRPMRERVWGK